MNHSTPGLPVHHQLPEFTQTHVHRVGDVIQPSNPLLSPSPPKVKLTLRTTIFLWIKQHNEDLSKYKRRNGVEQTSKILTQWLQEFLCVHQSLELQM
uniref:Uncharacterized protein n=1 Tax=Moschus moschiferus TaxID=68415 RepID=A0A8C6D9K3_MOSMO